MLMKRVLHQFARPEGCFGRMTTRMMNMGNVSQYRHVEHYMPLHKDKRILDIGYGNGALMKRLLKKGYHKVCGLEISRSMERNVTKRLLFYLEQKYLTLYEGIAENIPCENSSFDVVYSINTLYFWESLDVGLKEIRRVLKENGECILAFYDKDILERLADTRYEFHLYDDKDIRTAFLCNGFEVVNVDALRRHGWCIRARLKKEESYNAENIQAG